jgi:hypothetical protein
MADPESKTTESAEGAKESTESADSVDKVAETSEAKVEDATKAQETAVSQANPGDAAQIADGDKTDATKLPQHHVSNYLDDVLEQPKMGSEKHGYKHPMILDLILALSLLVAMGGFTVGLINIYITHQAEQSIMQRNYRAAITVLKGAPLAGFFTMPGSDPADLLNQALYLDAMERLDANGEDETALKDLEKIQAGSRYFDIAQDILKEHFKPSDTQLQGQADHTATPAESVAPKKPILPPAETDATP